MIQILSCRSPQDMLFFTVGLIDSIVNHINSYAYAHISWQEVTADDIKKMIALLIYLGLVRVGHSVEWYWSTATLFHGLSPYGYVAHC